MRLSDLQNKDVLSIVDGKVIGKIIDVVITDDGKIEKLVVEKYKFLVSMFTSKAEIEVLWNDIMKIGEDVILISLE